MADRSRNESITEVVPKALNKYFESEIPDLRETFEDFPESNLRLKMPCISTFVSNPTFRSELCPYPKEKITADDIKDHQAQVEWVVGEWEFNVQLDIWAGNKEELDDIFNQVFNALNKNIHPMGLELKLEEYYNQICSFLYVGHQRQNGGRSSQSDEWRMNLEVLATCKAIRTRKEFIIENTQTASELEDVSQIDETVIVNLEGES